MSMHSNSLQRCQSFINSNFVDSPPAKDRKPLAVTVSRQTYSRTHELAEELIMLLNGDKELGRNQWALFDRDLVHRILEDHNLPKRIARYMPEDRDHDFSGLINEILGVHPSLWELFHYTCDTIHKLARVGSVILIGRGAHIITRGMPHMVHVRVVAPFEMRVRRAAEKLKISLPEAQRQLQKEDQASVAYIRSHFDESLENPLAFHLTINTGKTSPRVAARVLHSFLRLR